ncbi:BNR repeat-containing protein [Leeuwenhoekiella sp. ZYFB001]|uniref:BNR repeat-containing protein n=1 Tax=Leeuwenhoekiella sp. ZYFB001 TaxID=2719912 RepID=UPI001430C9D2|nr:BNR repeat-containing protein [Leeuwenhoekiella sp. ZYFB001]
MYSTLIKINIFLVLACQTAVLLGQEAALKIKQRIEVDKIEASFPVGFSQVITAHKHYIAYYDADKNFSIAYRSLTDSLFKKTILHSKIGWDSHNYTTLIVDNEGYIHVSGNMHNDQLRYWRSEYPEDATSLKPIHFMTGNDEHSVTYPHFLKTNTGELLFHYRNGGSGNGYELYNKWNPNKKEWERFLEKPLIDGKGKKNAYMSGPFYEDDGYYHLYWVWRQSPDCSTNHDFSYARSKDLKHWENVAGTTVDSPMTFENQLLKVDSSPIKGSGMLNGVQAHALDEKNQIVLCNMKYDAEGNTQLYLYRSDGSKHWKEQQITNWEHRFKFSGWGSIDFDVQLINMQRLKNGNLSVVVKHKKYGLQQIIVDAKTLKPVSKKKWKAPLPEELTQSQRSDFGNKPIKVHLNTVGKYLLRWETSTANNDSKPSGKLPDPGKLELIILE